MRGRQGRLSAFAMATTDVTSNLSLTFSQRHMQKGQMLLSRYFTKKAHPLSIFSLYNTSCLIPTVFILSQVWHLLQQLHQPLVRLKLQLKCNFLFISVMARKLVIDLIAKKKIVRYILFPYVIIFNETSTTVLVSLSAMSGFRWWYHIHEHCCLAGLCGQVCVGAGGA